MGIKQDEQTICMRGPQKTNIAKERYMIFVLVVPSSEKEKISESEATSRQTKKHTVLVAA
jgi:hypothetical protein